MSISLWQVEKHINGQFVERKKVIARYAQEAIKRGYGYGHSVMDDNGNWVRWDPNQLPIGNEVTIKMRRLCTGKTTAWLMERHNLDRENSNIE